MSDYIRNKTQEGRYDAIGREHGARDRERNERVGKRGMGKRGRRGGGEGREREGGRERERERNRAVEKDRQKMSDCGSYKGL